MTDNTQPEALRLAEQYDYGDPVAHSNMWKAAVCTELRRQHTRIAELEAQLESIAASAGSELVAEVMFVDGKKYIQYTMPKELLPVGTKLYLRHSPPEEMVGGWMPIENAPKDGTSIIAYRPTSPPHIECMNWCAYEDADIPGAWHWAYDGEAPRENLPTHWMHIPEFAAPPTTSAGSVKGD